MTDQEKRIIKEEKGKILGFLAAIREENEALGEKLASMVSLIASLRKNYLGIKITIDTFEEKIYDR